MKDIDFDELDRAVSSALGVDVASVATPKPATPDVPEVKTPTVGAPAESGVSKPKTLVQKRSTGRFMDVVHPSAKLKHSKNTSSRQGVSIAAPEVDEPSVLQSTDSKQRTHDVLAVDAKPAPTKDVEEPRDFVSKESSHSFPDPLDFHNFSVEPEVQASDVSQRHKVVDNPFAAFMKDGVATDGQDDQESAQSALDEAASELSELDGLVHVDQDMPPLDTPFVQDLAVEKRPLGAFSLNDADMALLSDEAKAHIDATEDMSAATVASDIKEGDSAASASSVSGVSTSDFAEPDREVGDDTEIIGTVDPAVLRESDAQTAAGAEVMPEELRQDIVAVEAREVTVGGSSQLDTGSITQQYKEAAIAPPKEVAPIFDTESYHQPLVHTKKKAGWLSVIVIALLVLGGVGVGAAVYFLDLFNLFS